MSDKQRISESERKPHSSAAFLACISALSETANSRCKGRDECHDYEHGEDGVIENTSLETDVEYDELDQSVVRQSAKGVKQRSGVQACRILPHPLQLIRLPIAKDSRTL